MDDAKLRHLSSARRLAAIMFTDIVGYTALMGKDSAKALEVVRESKKIQKPLVEKYNGKWLKEMGDGAMASFNSALDAVNCALEIQRNSRADFEADLRIGIHSGDITIENEDIYGDGVNVASRLESIADPGGIYISESIEKAIRGQLTLQAKYLGEIKLKNVDYGVRTYALQGVGLPIPQIKDEQELSGHLLAEIQRRGVLRAAISYILISILLILSLNYLQEIDITVPLWIPSVLYIVLGVGFPVGLYLAWNYERSPEGLVKTSSKESWQNPYSASQRKPLTGPYLNLALTLILAFLYIYPKLNAPEDSISTTESNIIDKSIVVLPFKDLSPNKDQEHFSIGMMEEILNRLVKIEDLKVISGTTAIQYIGSDKTGKQIAEELGVATVLEGSIQKEGDLVKITYQLIDGKTDHHLFSDTYTQQLTSIFTIQSEIAQMVANKLQAQVTPEVKMRIEAIPTNDSRAYELYLRGREQYKIWWDKWDVSVIHQGIDYFNEAINLDPNFSNAYVGLGQAYWMLAHWAPDYDPVYWDLSKEYLNNAIELDPNNGWAYAELGVVQHNWDWDKEEAMRSFQMAVELSPGNWDVHNHFRNFLFRIKDCDGYEREAKILSSIDSKEYDPDLDWDLQLCRGNLDQISRFNWQDNDWVWILMFQEKYKEFIEYASDTSNVGPDNIITIGSLGEAYALAGDSLSAVGVINDLEVLSTKRHVSKCAFAPIYLALGDDEKAFQLLEEALEERDLAIHILDWAFVSFYRIQDDPRYIDLMERSWIPLVE